MMTMRDTQLQLATRQNGEAGAINRAPRRSAEPRPEIEARSLFNESREVVILHNDQRYVLRLTRLNKLILTK